MKKLLLLLAACCLVGACNESPTEPQSAACVPFLQSFANVNGDTVTTTQGVRYIDITQGVGRQATWGNVPVMNYSGYFISGTLFENNCQGDTSPLFFQLGTDGILPGLQFGLIGMQTSGVRRIIIPLELGYSTDTESRIFDIQLIEILN